MKSIIKWLRALIATSRSHLDALPGDSECSSRRHPRTEQNSAINNPAENDSIEPEIQHFIPEKPCDLNNMNQRLHWINPDGSYTTIYPNGQRQTHLPDGKAIGY